MKKITILMSLFLIALSSCSKTPDPRPTLSDEDRHDDRDDDRRHDRDDDYRDDDDDRRW